jgi:transporter family-2 protein
MRSATAPGAAATPAGDISAGAAAATAAPDGTSSVLCLLMAAALAISFGGGSVIQSGVNSSLGKRLGHALPASLVSFAGGWLFLLITYVVLWLRLWCCGSGNSIWRGADLQPGQRPWIGVRTSGLRWWELMGGALGCSSMVLNLLSLPVLGFALNNIMQVAGQLSASLLLDHIGFLGMPQRRLSADRLLGVLLVALGCALSIVTAPPQQQQRPEQADEAARGLPPPPLNFWLCICMATTAGAFPAIQSCVNRKIANRLPVRGVGGALISFSVGVASLSVANALLYSMRLPIGNAPTSDAPLLALGRVVHQFQKQGWMLTGRTTRLGSNISVLISQCPLARSSTVSCWRNAQICTVLHWPQQ